MNTSNEAAAIAAAADPWTFVEIDAGGPRRASAWELRRDNMRAKFVAYTGSQAKVVVTFSWTSSRTTDRGAKAYARAEACRFMAQTYDTVGDIECDVCLGGSEALDVTVLDSSTLSEATVTLVGADVFVAAVYFGNDFAEAVL